MDAIDSTIISSQLSDSTWFSFQEHVRDIVHKLQSTCNSDGTEKPIDLSFLFEGDDDVGDLPEIHKYQYPAESFPDSTEYHDDETLLEDFQTLLSDPLPNDASVITYDGLRLPLPSQVLCARSRYFHAMLSSRWAPASGDCLQKPDALSTEFSDALEYLVTGAITLSGRPQHAAQNVDLIILANHLLIPSLEFVIATHISKTLTLMSFQSYLSVSIFSSLSIADCTSFRSVFVPQSLEYVLSSYAVRHLEELCESLPRTWQYARPFWYLLTTLSMSCEETEIGHAHFEERPSLPLLHSKLRPFFIYISKVAMSVPLASVLARETPSTRRVLTNLLAHNQSEELMPQIRLLGLGSVERNLCTACTCSAPARKRFRFDYQTQGFAADLILSNVQYFESEHPHTSSSDVCTSLQQVNVPQIDWKAQVPVIASEQCLSQQSNSFTAQPFLLTNDGLECFDKVDSDSISTIILFDRYSSLGPNARLVFYRDDPINQGLAAELCTDCVSLENVPPTYIALPTTRFWFAFVRDIPAEHPPAHHWWGWRFAVFPALKQHIRALEAFFG